MARIILFIFAEAAWIPVFAGMTTLSTNRLVEIDIRLFCPWDPHRHDGHCQAALDGEGDFWSRR